MKIHVLPGDALAEDFRKANIEGEIVVCRECLIEGEIRAENLEDFWQTRAKFIAETYGEDESVYRRKVIAEFEKLRDAPDDSEINLWFEYELFCQANMWFCLALLQNRRLKVFRVAPIVRQKKDVWKGFGDLPKKDLEKCFAEKMKFSATDVALGASLWRAFQEQNFNELKRLGATESEAFPYLAEVCSAAIEKETRPRETLREIVSGGEKNFETIFEQFKKREGVYGFGDAQVKNLVAAI